MIHSPAALWKQRQRILPALMAVASSALLMVVQFGLLLGLFSPTSLPIDHSRADLWAGHPTIQSYDVGQPIEESWRNRVAREPEVVRTEVCLQGPVSVSNPGVRTEVFLLIATRLDAESLGAVHDLTPELRHRLTEPDTVVIDETSLAKFALDRIGTSVEISGRRVRIVGVVHNFSSTTMPFMFCSLETGRRLLRELLPNQVTYILAKCRTPSDAPVVADRLRHNYQMAALTSEEFSRLTRVYWLTKTKAGLATGWSALLGLMVGGVITSQTLYSATMAYRREFAVLRALGVPRWRLMASVLTQAFWVGCSGIVLALLLAFGLIYLSSTVGLPIVLPKELLLGAALATLLMALLASALALRSVQRIDPAELLH